MNENTNIIYESELCREVGIDRETGKRLRKELLREGLDWQNVPGNGIALTSEASQKIKAAVPARPESAPAGVALEVLRTGLPNPRAAIALFRKKGAPGGVRVSVIVLDRRGATTLMPGQLLEGCIPINDEVFQYAGPVPFRRGFALQKKEGGL